MSAPIVLFFLDQLRADALGVSGNSFVRTPSIDRLAKQSVRFETCITNAPLCRPARITMMTGMPVSQHRYDTNLRAPAPDSLPSHVRALRDEAGYHTAVVGKTHLHNGTGHLDQHRDVLQAWGFEESVELPDALEHQIRSAHTDWLSATTSKASIGKLELWRDYVVNHRKNQDCPDTAPWHLATEDHLDSFCARTAAELVRSYDGDRPLYLQVNFPGPHPPFDPTTEFVAPLDPLAANMPLPILGSSTGPVSPAARKYRRGKRRNGSVSDVRQLRRAYYGKVALVDRGVGTVLDALDDSKLAEDAWIILAADHGELLGDHHMTGKVLCYESAIRVPLLIRPPGGVDGWVDTGTVDLLDIVETIREIAGVGDGGLCERVTTGAGAHKHKHVVFENMGFVGIRTPQETLAWDRAAQQPVELYDRVIDPEQLHNVVEKPEYETRRDELVAQLH